MAGKSPLSSLGGIRVPAVALLLLLAAEWATAAGTAPHLDAYAEGDAYDPYDPETGKHHAPHGTGQITSTTGRAVSSASKMQASGAKASQLVEQQPEGSKVPILTILAMTTFMAAMSGLGAVPFFFVGKLKASWAGLANAVACGVMLAASFDLLHEGAPYSPTMTIAGMVLGGFFIKYSQEFLSRFEDASFEDLSGADARKAMLIVGVMAAHALGEGSGVGVSFSGNRGWAQGTLVTIAIGLHNIPEGMAVATVMVSKGTPPKTALFWSLFCAFPQALVAVPSYMFVETFQSLLPVAMGFAAGCMVWIVAAELMPDALEAAPHPAVATATTLSAAWLQGLSMLIATLETPGGTLESPWRADVRTLLACAAYLLPPLAAQLAAAAGISKGLPGLPAALGLTAGVMVGVGACDVLRLLVTGGLTWFGALVWAATGAGAALMAQRQVMAPPQLQVRRSLDTELEAAGVPPAQAEAGGAGGAHGWPGAHPAGGAAAHEGWGQHGSRAGEGGAAALPTLSLLNGSAGGTMDGKPGWPAIVGQGHGSLPVPPGLVPDTQPYAPARPPHPYSSYEHHGAEHHAHQAHNGNGPHNGLRNGVDYRDLDMHGFLHLRDSQRVEGHGPLHGYLVHEGASPRAHDGKKEVAQFSAAGGLPKQAKAAWLGAGVLLCHACGGTGVWLAQAIAAHAGEAVRGVGLGALFGHWLLPVALQGALMGAACVGLSKAVMGVRQRIAVYMAGVCAVATLMTLLGCLIPTDLGQPGSHTARTPYDAARWSDAVRAACGGALAFTGLRVVWPAAAHGHGHKSTRAQTGGLLGLGAAGGVQLLTLVLCWGTPYCVRLTQTSA